MYLRITGYRTISQASGRPSPPASRATPAESHDSLAQCVAHLHTWQHAPALHTAQQSVQVFKMQPSGENAKTNPQDSGQWVTRQQPSPRTGNMHICLSLGLGGKRTKLPRLLQRSSAYLLTQSQGQGEPPVKQPVPCFSVHTLMRRCCLQV